MTTSRIQTTYQMPDYRDDADVQSLTEQLAEIEARITAIDAYLDLSAEDRPTITGEMVVPWNVPSTFAEFIDVDEMDAEEIAEFVEDNCWTSRSELIDEQEEVEAAIREEQEQHHMFKITYDVLPDVLHDILCYANDRGLEIENYVNSGRSHYAYLTNGSAEIKIRLSDHRCNGRGGFAGHDDAGTIRFHSLPDVSCVIQNDQLDISRAIAAIDQLAVN